VKELKMNRWGIPEWLEKEVRERDKNCVYCGVQMIEKTPIHGSRKPVATWEHIINDANIITRENIARCCAACNSSKGTKKLTDWLRSDYCRDKGITVNTVADVVKRSLLNNA
jgi:5-methylcytosine-specific restriction endonuclease McrA